MRSDLSSLRSEAKSPASTLTDSAAGSKSHFLEYWELTKPRLSLLSVITAIVGYLAALPTRESWVLLAVICGTSLAAGGAAVLNQWMERQADAQMVRTKRRPIPSGTVSPDAALLYGLLLCALGDFVLWFWANWLAATLAVLTQVSYLLIYTPLKKHTPWCTHAGALPGALPPLIGWAAAEGRISPLGWILFAILLFWQIPHFMSLAWTYRRDYASAGFPMTSVLDPSGRGISLQSLLFTGLLILSSLLPSLCGYTTFFYTLVAFAAGAWILFHAVRFLDDGVRDRFARSLFVTSIAYLPILLSALVVDRILLV